MPKNKVVLDSINGVDTLVCDCGASAPNTSKAGKRFRERHPEKCSARREFNQQLAQGTRSVDADQHRFGQHMSDDPEDDGALFGVPRGDGTYFGQRRS